MWTEDKIESFSSPNYFSYRHYEGQYYPASRELKHDRRAPFSHRAPFENAAIDIAEFDTAIGRLNITEQGIFILFYIFQKPADELGKLTGLNPSVVNRIAIEAKAKVSAYLKFLDIKRKKDKYLTP